MARSALVIGGTGPTGPFVLDGLIRRGFDVTIFHRGTHEPEDLPPVRHIHGDPHFRESIVEALGDASYDVVVAAYGRTRLLAEALKGRAGQFLAIGGTPRYGAFYDPRSLYPYGLPVPVVETTPRSAPGGASASAKFGGQLAATEHAVFAAHPAATVLIYPVVYGPRNVVPWEWSIIKRARDGRRELLLPDGGLAIHSRGAPRNLAEFVLLAIDRPAVASGQVYNCADDVQYSLRQWAELIVGIVGGDTTIVGVPAAMAPAFTGIYLPSAGEISPHSIFDTSKAKRDLGYVDVVEPVKVLAESVEWYEANPVERPQGLGAFADRFDYELEDALIAAWRAAVSTVLAEVPQEVQEDVHPMPHPKQASSVDERGR